MLYYIIRPIVRFALKLFYRKIHLSNLENIPKGKPVILAANHPTAFMEPCILACFQKRGLFYIVRGDIFAHKFYAKILASLHMLPVYRKKDRGYKFIKQNYSTFSTCYQTLANKRTVMILAEGTTEHEKRLRPLVKGTARIAFGTLDEFPDMEDVYIVPVGVNYTYADQFRSEVYIDFGEAISTRSFEKIYRENANQGINDLTKLLQEKMFPGIIHIENEDDEDLLEKLFRLDRSRQTFRPFPVVSMDATPLKREKRLADFVNQLSAGKKEKLKQSVNDHFELLRQSGLANCRKFEKRGNAFLLLLLLAVLFPIFFIGYIFGYVPMWHARFVTNRRVKDITFRSSILMAVGVVGWLIWLLLLIIITVILKAWYLLILPIFSIVALYYLDVFDSWNCNRKLKGLSSEQRQRIAESEKELEKLLH